MKKLLAYAGNDLSILYARKNNFTSGKSLDYCTIGKLKFSRSGRVDELKNPDSAFRLGLEFGINVAIDTFNEVCSANAQQVSATLLPNGMTKKLKVIRKRSKK
jgi:hypothetical protein